MKKIIFLVAVALLFITCKKEQKLPRVIDATGTWTLYSWKETPAGSLDVNADQFPCISNNVLTFNKDQTFTRNYVGKDTCFVASSPITWMGMPGQASLTGSWHQDGNTVYWYSSHGTISTSNGKTFLTSIDTVNGAGNRYTITTVDIKK
jgi:hypothetical protein